MSVHAPAATIRFPHETPPTPGEGITLAEGVLWLRLPLPTMLDHVNVYALDDGDGWSVIDTGVASTRTREIWGQLIAGPLAGRPVRRVIVTHHHPDHIGLAGWFQEQGAELWTTRTAWLFARMLTLDVQTEPVEQALDFWRAAGMPPDMLAARRTERPFNFADIVSPLPLGFRRLCDGDVLTMGGRRWIVRTGSGHAPEHATFWSLDDNLVIGGDQLLPGISANLGVYPTEPDADPVAEWLVSCARFLPHATDAQLVLPGHKLPFTGLPLRLRQMIDNHTGALERLQIHLGQPRRAVDCFPVLFRREVGPAEFGLAMAESVAHLNHLLHLGRVQRRRDNDGAWVWQAIP